MKVKSQSEVAQLCPTLRNPMDCSLLGSSAHEIFQARVLEWVAIASYLILTALFFFVKVLTVIYAENLSFLEPGRGLY